MAETPVAPPRRAVSPAPGEPAAPRRGGLVRDAALAVNLQVTRRHPVSMVHFVTRRCNARCSFCFIDFDDPSPKSAELTAEEIDRLTRTMGPHLQNVNITGGEPFLRGDLIDIVRSYYRNTPVRSVYITSNGALTDRTLALAERVTEEFPDRLLIVSLSVDAFPDDHDRIRKIPGLFDKVMATYHGLQEMGGGVLVNVGITVSHENHAVVPALYDDLIERGVRSITAIIVRDEGVYAIPEEHKADILAAYRWLTSAIGRDQASGRLEGYDPATVQGRLMNAKNELLWDIVADTYLEPHYVSPCHAGSLFGVIDADGTVHPCEVLDRPLGNVRDHDLDLGALWRAEAARTTTKWIRDTHCNCSYECAWGFNIAGNLRYQPRLLRAALGR
jgi:radical SAM protein with 4Fe4S-binding SPASM domain